MTDKKTTAIQQKNVFMLDVNKIDIVEGFNARTDFTDIDKLVDSIKAANYEVLNPITVQEYTDEKGETRYRLIDGERRLRAVRIINKAQVMIQRIRAIKESNSLSEEDKIIQHVLRNEGKNFSEYEYGRAYDALRRRGYSNVEIAKKLGKSEWQVSAALALLEKNEEMQQMLASGETTALVAREALRANGNDEAAATKELKRVRDNNEKIGKKKITLGDFDKNTRLRHVKDTRTIFKALKIICDYGKFAENGFNTKIPREKMNIFDIFDFFKAHPDETITTYVNSVCEEASGRKVTVPLK